MLENDVLEAEKQCLGVSHGKYTNATEGNHEIIDSSCQVHLKTGKQYEVIGFEHMNMAKFTAFSIANSIFLRTILYPTVLIKTRLQCDPGGKLNTF